MHAEVLQHVEYGLEPQVLHPALAVLVQRQTQVLQQRGREGEREREREREQKQKKGEERGVWVSFGCYLAGISPNMVQMLPLPFHIQTHWYFPTHM